MLAAAALAGRVAHAGKVSTEKAETLLAEGDWERAAREFEAAQAASKDPNLFYSIGQAYQMLGDPKRAVQAYGRYISALPGGNKAVEVDKLIEELTPLTLDNAKPPKKDTVPPRIRHQPIDKWAHGKTITLEADLEDPSGIFEPKLYYRAGGVGGNYIPTKLKPAAGKRYQGLIAPVDAGEVEYFLEAYDGKGNGPTRLGTPTYPNSILLTGKLADEPEPPPAPPPPPAMAALPPPPGPPAPELLIVSGGQERGPWAYVALGVGGVAAAAGLLFGALAVGSAGTANRAADPAAWQQAHDSAVGSSRVATLSWVVSVAASGAGVALLLFTEF